MGLHKTLHRQHTCARIVRDSGANHVLTTSYKLTRSILLDNNDF